MDQKLLNRREFMGQAGAGIAALAAAPFLGASASAVPRQKARSVIFLLMVGGPSQVDTFDPKPALNRYHGLPLRGRDEVSTFFGSPGPLKRSPFTFAKHGQSGIEISELFPELARHADDLCLIRSVHGDSNNHAPALFQMTTGSTVHGTASLGARVAMAEQGSGSIPFAVLPDPRGLPLGGALHWSAGELGSQHSGKSIYVPSRDEPARETALYGLDRPAAEDFGRRCLAARRLVEQGSRFVLVTSGGRTGDSDSTWDAHVNVVGNHRRRAAETDGPIAGLLTDLRQRGMLEETLVVWAGEFGRMPLSQGRGGRDHNPNAQTVWMAGAGVRGGTVIGATDELGLEAVERPCHVRDLHAMILHAACGNNGLDRSPD